MADVEGNLKTISKAIQTTQRLRGSVGRVFSQLRDGMEGGETAGERSKAFLDQLRENLLAVNKEYDELEKLSTAVTKQSDQLPTGSSGLLSLDPVQDKTPLYGQLLQSYKWSNKVHEHAGYTAQLLNQNSLKRSSMMTGLSTKRRKPQSTSHALPGQGPVICRYVDAVVANLQRHFPNMNITMTRPFGQSAVLQIGLGRTLQAIVVLRGLLIDRVVVKGFQENITQEDGKLDIWSKSQFKVFEKISDHATAATLHYQHPIHPDLALQTFLTWLNSYTTLFTATCHRCGRHLQDGLPPTWRDFRTTDPYHENCRQ
ncbi:PREDICTED: mediator of RNA polymerase II transcription subunit 27-like isoform X1 [Branchiostoma belcheri]|uniref:Mediator of RNA polymerase II transcription subunit 27-like isoform X1 n=1 Tax=Branchiostoma belcheri TaxID=7741 RepID=A0A6P5AGS6_BRABE|nr:PREDICTED: mediator of RNA polymerase II transcription subunit 27-like isoform X1 [Branchiostoma belcheri]